MRTLTYPDVPQDELTAPTPQLIEVPWDICAVQPLVGIVQVVRAGKPDVPVIPDPLPNTVAAATVLQVRCPLPSGLQFGSSGCAALAVVCAAAAAEDADAAEARAVESSADPESAAEAFAAAALAVDCVAETAAALTAASAVRLVCTASTYSLSAACIAAVGSLGSTMGTVITQLPVPVEHPGPGAPAGPAVEDAIDERFGTKLSRLQTVSYTHLTLPTN